MIKRLMLSKTFAAAVIAGFFALPLVLAPSREAEAQLGFTTGLIVGSALGDDAPSSVPSSIGGIPGECFLMQNEADYLACRWGSIAYQAQVGTGRCEWNSWKERMQERAAKWSGYCDLDRRVHLEWEGLVARAKAAQKPAE